MQIEGIEVKECKPYEARLTPRACGLRRAKVVELSDKIKMGAMGHIGEREEFECLKFCLTCDNATELKEEDYCLEKGCINPSGANGYCKKHTRIIKEEEKREKNEKRKKRRVKSKSGLICKICGQAALVYKSRFNFKQEKHVTCIVTEKRDADLKAKGLPLRNTKRRRLASRQRASAEAQV